MIKDIVKEYGHLDILVNNAGITKDGLIMKMKEEDFDSVLNVNLKGTFNTIRHSARQMLKQRSERSSIFLPSGEMPALPVRFYILQQKVVSMLLQRLWQKRLLQAIFR